MFIHRRRAGDASGRSCDTESSHEEAESLWHEAVAMYRVHECAFLRTYELGSVQQESVTLADLR